MFVYKFFCKQVYDKKDLMTAITTKPVDRNYVLFLLNTAGINPNFLDTSGSSPLCYAVCQSLTTSIFDLLEHKADPNDASFLGRKLLQLSFNHNQISIAHLFVFFGATFDGVEFKENEKAIKEQLEQKRVFYLKAIKPHMPPSTVYAFQQLGTAWLEISSQEPAKELKDCYIKKANAYLDQARLLEKGQPKIKHEAKNTAPKKVPAIALPAAGLRHRATTDYQLLSEQPVAPSSHCKHKLSH